MSVLHHGEVQTTGGVFRKKKEYLVLTNSHLLRFKNQSKASESFPSIPSSLGRSTSARHSRMNSIGSVSDLQALQENYSGFPLNDIVAVYKLDDGRPYFSIEITHLNDSNSAASTLSLQLDDPRESDLWLTSIRTAITKARLSDPSPFSKQTVEHVARALELEQDYDPQRFYMFTVVKRAIKGSARSSTDDLSKLTSSMCYLAIGAHKVHLVPLLKPAKSASTTSLVEPPSKSYGIVTLHSLVVQSFDDTFQLAFRFPLQKPSVLHLASSSVTDIALCIRQAADYVRPEWLELPFSWNVPPSLDDALLSLPYSEPDEHLHFDRTLAAYCAGFGLNASHIRYTVNYECEDSPEFELLAPTRKRVPRYTMLELLAVLRALRYNESFHSITFRNVNLDSLQKAHDAYGSDHMLTTTRTGDTIRNLRQQDHHWLLVLEIQALALKSKRLRRIDFSNCLSRKPPEIDTTLDGGCGLCEAIFPLCQQQLTNVDWIILNGITLAEVDIDYFYAAAIERKCHLRALEMGNCGLSDSSISIIMDGISCQQDTLESIDLSRNPGRLNTESLKRQLSQFGCIRKLNLSNMQFNSGTEPVIGSEILLQWRLEELTLNGTRLNGESLDAVATYLKSSQSNILRHLRFDQCQLTSKDVAKLLEPMANSKNKVRNLHLWLCENRLQQYHHMLTDAIGQSMTPSHMTMQMLEYGDEKDARALFSAISMNTTLRFLDISHISLPIDATQETCQALRHMFEANDTLEELDISGEQSHLEAVTLGKGLSDALKGLAQNRTLKILRVEHQVLGLPGASSLATVIQQNKALREIHCEDNEINLQAFTVLVNAVSSNTTLTYLPDMDKDRIWSRKKLNREVESLRENKGSPSPIPKGTVKKIGGMMGRGRSSSASKSTDKAGLLRFTEQDMSAALRTLDQKWTFEVTRLHGYLRRNYCIAHGMPVPLDEPTELHSPSTGSFAHALQQARIDRTPTLERSLQNLQLGDGVVEDEDEDVLEKMNILGITDSEDTTPSVSPPDYDEKYDEKALESGSGEEYDMEEALIMKQKGFN